MKKVALIQGNEACAQAAIYAGCRFFAGYPITPSSEIAEVLSRKLPEIGGTFIQMEDEIGAMAAVIGASLCGLKAMDATSGPGLSLKQELIGYACMAEIPCVLVNVMRGGPSTGMPTGPSQSDIMATRWGTHGDHATIAVAPASCQEIFSETVRAFNLAETYRLPVHILMDEIIAHMREKIVFPEEGELEVLNRAEPTVPPAAYKPFDASFGDVPPLAAMGSNYRYHVTGLNKAEDGFPTTKAALVDAEERRQLRKVDVAAVAKNEEYLLDDAEFVIVSFGVVSRSARFAINQLRNRGIRAGMLRPITLWPFPAQRVAEVAKNARAVIVPEMNLGQMIGEVERAVCGACPTRSILRVDGEPITPQQIIDEVEEVQHVL
ncbi:MAG: 2-oxoacid:acceptor oxidoreductase subunit alpha [Deltaproteobacteria bacterium]|nr:2-oxoacid:acceptor oxidoreductase subunit alpha [Deltaproteobacteria bacterium]